MCVEMQMFALPFNYRKKEYHSVIRIKQRYDEVKLEVTILNGDLEWTLYGYHVFTFCDGCISCKDQPDSEKVKELQLQLKHAIDMFIREHPLQVA